MSAYVDSSVLLSHYLAEPDSAKALGFLRGEVTKSAARTVEIEVRRGLARIESIVERTLARAVFVHDWQTVNIVELDAEVSGMAATIAEATGLRTLDSIHVAAAISASCERFITFDRRQAEAATQFGLTVVGVDD